MGIKKVLRFWKAHGTKQLCVRMGCAVAGKTYEEMPYKTWRKKHVPGKKQLEAQRQKKFAYAPKISIVVPLYRTPQVYLDALIASVEAQTYTNWELCLSDGSGADSPLRGLLSDYAAKDKRIRVIGHETSLRIAENTNAALEVASGEYIGFADHDDLLAPDLLYACVEALNQEGSIDFLYTDEDKVDRAGKVYFEPQFKPDLNIDLLRTVNYICHFVLVKKNLLGKVGTLDPVYDGAQDYDFVLRCVEQAGKVYHIPKALYHWRSHKDSTAEDPESKSYAFEAGRRAIEAHYKRSGIQAEVTMGEYPGLYRTTYHRNYDPLISILIPNKDHVDDLERCINSIDQRSSYRNYEIIVVENNSTEAATFAYYETIKERHPKADVVYWKHEFNYSAINNYGATFAKGEYLLLLNNDTEIINADCLEQLLGYGMRPDVGAVGARLYYEDGTIQHAGVVMGFGGIAGHCFVQQPKGATGYCHRIICAQDYSAVTAACMLVRTDVFHEVGGLTESLAVAFNDIDLCMKIRKAGKLIVYNPYAELYHYESKSRGLEDTPEKIRRFQGEIKKMEERWPDILRDGDPYYNPNLTLTSQNFSLKKPQEELK